MARWRDTLRGLEAASELATTSRKVDELGRAIDSLSGHTERALRHLLHLRRELPVMTSAYTRASEVEEQLRTILEVLTGSTLLPEEWRAARTAQYAAQVHQAIEDAGGPEAFVAHDAPEYRREPWAQAVAEGRVAHLYEDDRRTPLCRSNVAPAPVQAGQLVAHCPDCSRISKGREHG